MKHLFRYTIALIVAATCCTVAYAAPQQKKFSERDRQKGLAEMRNFKHAMFTRELDLTKDQQEKFFDEYDKMDDELMEVGREVRELEIRVKNDANATDAEYTEAAKAMFELKKREAEIELSYFDKFAEILTPRQLMKIKPTERKIAMRLANYHGWKAHERKAKNRA